MGGVVLLFIPGPGILLIAFGGALVAQQSLVDGKAAGPDGAPRPEGGDARGERFWKKASTPVRVALVAAGLALATGAACLAYLWLFRK